MPSATTFALFCAAALLGVTFVALAVVSDTTYAVVTSALADRVRGNRGAARLRRYGSGGVFVALGVTAATARRSS